MQYVQKLIISLLCLFTLSNCISINSSENLNKSDIEYIQNLGLLDKDENILIFSTTFTTRTSGNFITSKRIASYWIDKDITKSYKNFAYFTDIIKIDSIYLTKSWTYSSYLIIQLKDSSNFKVYIEGSKEKYQSFVKVAFKQWK